MTDRIHHTLMQVKNRIAGQIAVLVILVFPLVARGQIVTNTPVSAGLDDQIQLRPGDIVSFRIENDTNDTVHLTVTDTGELEVPYVGRVKAEGQTCRRLAGQLKTMLEKDYYYHATVMLAIDSFHDERAGKAYVTGEVRNPGPISISPDQKLMVSEAILNAGGFSEFADRRRVKVMRQSGSSNSVTTYYVDVLAVWKNGQKNKDLGLMAGDQIFVASKLVNF